MSDRDLTPSDGLLDYLRVARVGRHRAVESRGLPPGLLALRRWQTERLARTHADLLAHPRYGPACRFFLSDVYGARDFSQRDHDLLTVYESMRSVLPPPLRRALELAVVLNDLTQDLDEALLRALGGEPGGAPAITAER
jgi:hypothetical protein